MTSPPAPTARTRLARLLLPLGAALMLLAPVPTELALLCGLALALLVGNPFLELTKKASPRLLSWAVIGLGAGMDLGRVAAAGAHGALYTVASISGCAALGLGLARLLRVPGRTGALITAGTAICGGSAIAALVPVLRPKDQEVSVALGTVFVLNAVALFAFPSIGHALQVEAGRFGLWCALAIHDTSSVVGAALAYGPKALEVATTVKLARALWIVPITLGAGLWARRAAGADGAVARPRRPWFILGFVVAAALVTWVPALRPAGAAVATAAKRVMVLTLFLIGANLTPAALRAVGVRPLVQGFLLWIAVASLSLGAIAAGWIG